MSVPSLERQRCTGAAATAEGQQRHALELIELDAMATTSNRRGTIEIFQPQACCDSDDVQQRFVLERGECDHYALDVVLPTCGLEVPDASEALDAVASVAGAGSAGVFDIDVALRTVPYSGCVWKLARDESVATTPDRRRGRVRACAICAKLPAQSSGSRLSARIPVRRT